MTRQEFLEELRIALQGEVTPAVLNDNLRYYETYIMEESRKGRSEEDVIEELGNPRLLARTVIDTSGSGRTSGPVHETYQEYEENRDDGVHVNMNGRNYHKSRKQVKVAAWVAVAVVVAVVILLLVLVGSVISLLAPVIVPVILVLILIGVLSGRK